MNAVLTHVEQATPQWLTVLLRERGVLTTGQVVAVDDRPSTAWNSRAFHLALRYSGDAPTHAPRRLFLKLNLQPEWGRAEVSFYQYVISERADLPMLVRCYDAAYSAEDGRSHLLLADASDTHFTPVTKPQLLAGETMPAQAHLEAMVDALARLHAYWWEHPQLGHGFARIRHWFDGEAAYRQHTERRQREWAAFQAQAGHLISAETWALYARVLAAFPELWPRYLVGRFEPLRAVTLSHGDCYFIQFLCPRQAGSAATYLIDFDSVSTNLPAYDLVYMLATFWTPEQRSEGGCEANLLRRYHAALTAQGLRGYDWADLMQDYRLCILYMLFDPIWDQTSGASEAYWLPKLRCLTGAFRALDGLSLLPH
jgi:thiamine kinase-like enzyme